MANSLLPDVTFNRVANFLTDKARIALRNSAKGLLIRHEIAMINLSIPRTIIAPNKIMIHLARSATIAEFVTVVKLCSLIRADNCSNRDIITFSVIIDSCCPNAKKSSFSNCCKRN